MMIMMMIIIIIIMYDDDDDDDDDNNTIRIIIIVIIITIIKCLFIKRHISQEHTAHYHKKHIKETIAELNTNVNTHQMCNHKIRRMVQIGHQEPVTT